MNDEEDIWPWPWPENEPSTGDLRDRIAANRARLLDQMVGGEPEAPVMVSESGTTQPPTDEVFPNPRWVMTAPGSFKLPDETKDETC